MTVILEVLKRGPMNASIHSDLTTIVNLSFFGVFLLLSFLVRYLHVASWLVCPFTTAFAFYYCSMVRLDDENTT